MFFTEISLLILQTTDINLYIATNIFTNFISGFSGLNKWENFYFL
jgi:hypothetical protein